MRQERTRRRAILSLVALALAALAQALGLRLLAEVDLMAAILASGSLEALALLPLTLLFLTLRLFVFLIAPGLALLSLGRLLWSFRRRPGAEVR